MIMKKINGESREAELLADILGMRDHPEGGLFADAFASEGTIPGGRELGFSGERRFLTSIYYLLRRGERSRPHRLRQDEIWHFYRGDPVMMVMISPGGELSRAALGQRVEDGESPQCAVRGGTWFAAASNGPVGYSLVGCTVAPGFHYDDLELATEDELSAMFPASNLGKLMQDFFGG
jgi:predicted cupin superfamily sugar epimerase